MYINTRAASCSIYKSGVHFFETIRYRDGWYCDYIEIDCLETEQLHQGNLKVINGALLDPYDVYIFNYHPVTMRDMEHIDSSQFHKLPGLKFHMILEMLPDDPITCLGGQDHFDGYLVMDPTMRWPDKRFHAFSRTIPEYRGKAYTEQEIPVIGSFGYATTGKRFDKVIEAVSKEFKEAIVRIHIAQASYADGDKQLVRQIEKDCLELAPVGIRLEFSHWPFGDKELVDWCSQNTLNMFFYERDIPGLAATPDQAVACARPFITNQNQTFRHVLQYQPAYPDCSLRDMIAAGNKYVNQMYTDWGAKNCQQRLLQIIQQHQEGLV
jgi:hypothetical protein